MAFVETPRFPDYISRGSQGGPGYMTRITNYGAGYEARDILWTYGQHRYDVSYGLKEIQYVYDLVEFFHAMKGRGHSFRFKDYADYKSCAIEATIASTDQIISTGTSSTTTDYQIKKIYTAGVATTRSITKPISTSLLVSINGTDTTAFTVSSTSGIITFTAAPATDATITAGYEFDVPCRFDSDYLPVELEQSDIAGASIVIVEDKFYAVSVTS